MIRANAHRTRLAARIREIRVDRFGESHEAIIKLANTLGIPPQTWVNYESGVVMPAEILLGLIDVTGVDARWLRTGDGERYATPHFASERRFDL